MTPSPKEGSPVEKYKPRRGATPELNNVGQWGLDRVIEDIEKEEMRRADEARRKRRQGRQRRQGMPGYRARF